MNNKGFGIVELLTAVSVSVIVIYTIGSMTENNARMQNSVSAINDLDTLANNIRLAMDNTVSTNGCTDVLSNPAPSGFPISSSTPLNSLTLPSGMPPISVGSVYGGLTIAGITLDPGPSCGANCQTVDLTIVGSKNQQSVGGSSISKKIRLSVTYGGATNALTRCVPSDACAMLNGGNTPGGSGSLWVLGPNGECRPAPGMATFPTATPDIGWEMNEQLAYGNNPMTLGCLTPTKKIIGGSCSQLLDTTLKSEITPDGKSWFCLYNTAGPRTHIIQVYCANP